VAKNFQDYFISVITQRLGAQLYADGIRHTLAVPYQVFEDQRSGETLGKLQKVRTDVERLIKASIDILFTTLVGIVFVTVYALSVHWIIAPAYFFCVPALALLSSTLSKKIKTVQSAIVKETAALAGSTTESLRNIELVKSLGLAAQEVRRLNATTDKILALELRKVRYLRSLSFIQGTAVNALRTSILGLMLYLIYTQRISVGQFFSLWIYSFFIFGPLQQVGDVIAIFRETEASLGQYEAILAIPAEKRPAQPVVVDPLRDLGFDSVSFSHLTASGPALENVSFSVRRGETIAFVGPSGAGKTTLVKLLVGLYHPQTGKILYNGHPEDVVDLDRLRERLGLVTQDTQLFSGTIRENLVFVRPEATDAEILEVLNQAACQSLLARASRGPRLPSSARAGSRSPAASASASPSRGPCCAAPSPRLRRSDVIARFAHRGRHRADHPRSGRDGRCDHHTDRASTVDGHARGSDLRAGAGTRGRERQARRAVAGKRAVLRDVETASRRTPPGSAWQCRRGAIARSRYRVGEADRG
jgi:ATP-binding cassette subfamily B protein